MNQLTPPPERDLPARRHTQTRRALTRYVTPAARPSRSLRTPVLAAGAVASIAAVSMVGFSAWPGGDSGSPGPGPGRPGEPSAANPGLDGRSPPADPVRWCHQLLDDEFLTPKEAPDDPDFAQWPLETGPVLPTPSGTVQLLVDRAGESWWACDSTSGGYWLGLTLPGSNERWDYSLLSDNTGTVEGPATYFWGAGRMPPGVDAVRFTFPDGHVEDATVEDGYWLVTYQAAEAFPNDATVRAEAGGKSFTVGWRICRSGDTAPLSSCTSSEMSS